jgi:hypothetical protein
MAVEVIMAAGEAITAVDAHTQEREASAVDAAAGDVNNSPGHPF